MPVFLDKILKFLKFWKDPEFIEELIEYKRHWEGLEFNFRKFIDKRLGGIYFKRFCYFVYPRIKLFSQWAFIILLNGSLMYVAYIGIVNPINWVHSVFALGLGIWIPTRIISKAYNRISKDKLERVKAIPQPPIIR